MISSKTKIINKKKKILKFQWNRQRQNLIKLLKISKKLSNTKFNKIIKKKN
jgi:hypothetical protein